MTVEQYFSSEKIDLDFVQNTSEEKDETGLGYWTSSFRFIKQNWQTEWKKLTIKQTNWATKILDDCIEYRIEGRR